MSIAHYLTKLVRHSAVYGLADALGRAMGFLLIPFYTRALPQEAFGQLEVLHVFQSFGIMTLSLGQISTLMRYFSRTESDEERAEVVAGVTPIVTVSGLLFLGVLFLSAPWFATRLFSDRSLDSLFVVLAAGIVARVLTDIPLTLFRLREKSLSYGFSSLLRLLVTLVVILVLVVRFDWGLRGVIVGEAIGSILLFLVLAPRFLRELGPFPGFAVVREHLRFGWPLALTNVGAVALLGLDKLFLAGFGHITDAAIYSIGGKFLALMNILVFAPFTLVWGPLMLRIPREQSDSEAKRIFSRLLTYFCVVVLSISVGLLLFSREIIALAAPESYASAISVVPLLLVASFCLGANKHFQAGLHITGNTTPLATSFLIAGGLNIVGNYFLIPPFGIVGAAITSAISYLLMCGLLARASYRRYPIRYEWKRIGMLVSFAAVVSATTLFWNQLDSGVLATIGKGVAFALFPLGLWWGGFFSRTERREALGWARRIGSRG